MMGEVSPRWEKLSFPQARQGFNLASKSRLRRERPGGARHQEKHPRVDALSETRLGEASPGVEHLMVSLSLADRDPFAPKSVESCAMYSDKGKRDRIVL
jgi:hypothetical protein